MREIIVKVYEFDELNEEAKLVAISGQVNVEVELMTESSPYYPAVLAMEEMRTPWFLEQEIFDNYQDLLIGTIKSRKFEYTEDGRFYYENKGLAFFVE